MAQRQGLDERLGGQRSAQPDQDFAPRRPHRAPYRRANHLRGDRPSGILAQARHPVPAEIGHPDLDDALRHAKGGGSLDARPTIDDDALNDLASLSNVDCSAAQRRVLHAPRTRGHLREFPANQPVTSTTIRPRIAPPRILGASSGRAESGTVSVIRSSLSSGRSRTRRCHASIRSSRGHMTESMPSRLTPRSRNGITVAGRSLPPASPQAATLARYLSWVRIVARVVPPTASIAPAQRSVSSGRDGFAARVARSIRSAAPSSIR